MPRTLLLASIFLLHANGPAAEYHMAQDASAAAGGGASSETYSVTDIGGQSLIGQSSSANYTLDAGFWPTVSSQPIPGALTLTVLAAESITLPMDAILSAATDPDGDSIQVITAGPLSQQGGTVVLTGKTLSYTAPSGFFGVDDFVYTLLDSGGDVVAGTISVMVKPDENTSPAVVHGPFLIEGVFLVRYAGIPLVTYTIEVTDGLAPANWKKWINVTAPAEGESGPGIFEVRHIANAATCFFRVVYPSY